MKKLIPFMIILITLAAVIALLYVSQANAAFP